MSIIIIGILTAFIGDIASGFGCTLGVKDSVTAITFVAVGTSLPGKCKFRLNEDQDTGWFRQFPSINLRSILCGCFSLHVSVYIPGFLYIFSRLPVV